MATQASNHIKYLIATGAIDFSSDTFKIILMEEGFTFNIDTHEEYADVSASELATGNGYTQFTLDLAGVTVTEDDANDYCSVTWNDAQWTAAGGDIGPAAGAIICDDTVANDPIVGYIDFGGSFTQADGGTGSVRNIELRLV